MTLLEAHLLDMLDKIVKHAAAPIQGTNYATQAVPAVLIEQARSLSKKTKEKYLA